MKKTLFLSILLLGILSGINAQVFNTSSTLKRGQFSAGFEPGLYVGNDISLFLHGGAGITSGVDFGVKLGFFNEGTYFGGDVEFNVVRFFSISAGAHAHGNFGLDGTGLFTFPLGGVAKIYTGLDADVEFHPNDIDIPLYIPVGLEIPLKSFMLFVFESEICITPVGQHYLGGGLNFIF